MKISVVGMGYVGLSNAVLLSQQHEVVAFDIDAKKISLLNSKQSPINDTDIENFLLNKNLNITATSDKKIAYDNSDYIIIATPTNYDPDKNKFDTSSIEEVIKDILAMSPRSVIVIKSTIPMDYVCNIRKKFKINNIFFSPEFLREGLALHDNLYPSRIVIGDNSESAKTFSNLLKNCAIKEDINILLTGPSEAEAIKLFSNAYLAMRVAYINELDSYAEIKNLNSKEIIQGISLDPRIGSHYNNPSFGYGGYCLPKDTKQLKANFKDVPSAIIDAIVKSNDIRKDFIANMIIRKNPKVVGIHRLIMKTASDNFRESSVLDIMKRIKENGVDLIIYEPELPIEEYGNELYLGAKIINDLNNFKLKSDLIMANRKVRELDDVLDKVYSRDLFNSD